MSYMCQVLTSVQGGVYSVHNEEIIMSVCVVGSVNIYNTVLYIIKMCPDLLFLVYLIGTVCLNCPVFM
jgi:hypothetical protein